MALASAVAGARRPSQLITWARADGTAENLDGATVTGKIQSVHGGAARDITGLLTVTNGTGGVFRWDYSVADIEEAGTFWVQFTASFANSPTPARTFRAEWTVEPEL